MTERNSEYANEATALKFTSEKFGVELMVPNKADIGLLERHELFIIEWLRDGIGIDIGACVGSVTLPFALRNQFNTVVAIEPQTNIFLCLLYNIHALHLRNVIPLNFAVSDRSGKIKLNIGKSTGHSSLLETRFDGSLFLSSETVNAITVSEIVDLLHLRKIDWIKLDTEGYEHIILQSLDEICHKHQPDLIIEYHNNLDEVKKTLEHLKYRIDILKIDWEKHGWIKAVKG